MEEEDLVKALVDIAEQLHRISNLLWEIARNQSAKMLKKREGEKTT